MPTADPDIVWEVIVKQQLRREELSQAQKDLLKQIWEHSTDCKPTSCGNTNTCVIRLEWDHTYTNEIVLNIGIYADGKVDWYYENRKTGELLSTHNEAVPVLRPVFWDLLKEAVSDSWISKDTLWVPGSGDLRCGCAWFPYDGTEQGDAGEMQRCILVKDHRGPCDYSKP